MEKELRNLIQVISIKVNLFQENQMDMVNITGHRVVFTKVNSKMALDKVMEYGRKIQDKVINMKEIIFMIKKKVMEYSHGNKATSTKETITMI